MLCGMARWEPGAAARLREAALRLFAEQGFDATTATEIATTAGLNERTFFRHFGDKREVLFHGQEAYLATFLEGIESAPDGAGLPDLVAAALRSASVGFPDSRRADSRRRQAIIAATPALQERDRHKTAVLAERLAAALRGRGVAEPAATLAGESAATVFAVSFAQWLAAGERRPLADIADDTWATMLTLGST